MAIRKVPTIFADSESLKVSVSDDGIFYISPGLIFIGGKSFFFKGGKGTLEAATCRIGIQVEGKFSELYSVNWPLHGDEVLVQAFYNLYGDAPESVSEPTQGGGGLQIGSLDEDPSTTEEDREESTECKAARATIKKEKYPTSYTESRFVSEPNKITAISLPLSSHSDNFKCLATFVKNERLYQHLYGPISFNPIPIKTKNETFAASFSVFGDCYASELINNKDIVLI
jgi:hypothetical protein